MNHNHNLSFQPKCGQDLKGIMALAAVESRLIDLADEDCGKGMLHRSGTTKSLQGALQVPHFILGTSYLISYNPDDLTLNQLVTLIFMHLLVCCASLPKNYLRI